MNYHTYVITFLDGTTEERYANRTRVTEGVLDIWQESHGVREMKHYPLVNIKSWGVK